MDTHGRAILLSSPSCDFFAMVELEHLRERIHNIHLAKPPAVDSRMEAINGEMNIQIFLNELQDWSDNTSEEVKNLSAYRIPPRNDKHKRGGISQLTIS
jgi:hypothetical protein